MKKLSLQDIHDILNGCVILGTGGGGELSEGLEMVDEAISSGKEFIMVDVDEIPDDSIIFTPYLLGAISELPEDELKKYENLPQSTEKPILIAVNRLEKHIGKKMYGTIAGEAGGANTAVPIYVAAMKGVYVLDADVAGRAVPECNNSTYYINRLPVAPVAVSNEFGEVAIYENIKDDVREEDILRSFAMVSKNNIACVDHALEMKVLKNAIIPGTLSKAMALGKAFRTAKENNENIAEKIAIAAGGKIAFIGKVESFEWKTESGFTIGAFEADGSDKYTGDKLKVWFQNENLMSWLNDDIYVTLPDLICVIDMDNNEPVTNPNYRKDMNIAVVIYPAPEAFTTSIGLDAFGPRRFGFDIDYMPAMGRI
ncbi:MAG: DUF917 domain-containing protein [Desulfobacterales bacterium]|nr:DUF917 domain-containing protein [Desulfobacterales bacterium]